MLEPKPAGETHRRGNFVNLRVVPSPRCFLQEATLEKRRVSFKSPPVSFTSPKERFQDACRNRIRLQKESLVKRFRSQRMADSLAQLRDLVAEAMTEEREEAGDDDELRYDPEFWESGQESSHYGPG